MKKATPAARGRRNPRGRGGAAPVLRLGNHVSIAGGLESAPERAHQLGCDAFQMFSGNPRQWRPGAVAAEAAAEFQRRRRDYGLGPVVIHANYLINLAGGQAGLHARSLAAFRGELERAVALGADYLVMHPGSAAGGDRAGARTRLVESIRRCADGLAWGGLRLLLENTAGGGALLGGSFAELAELLQGLAPLPVDCCIDVCHAWVAGYDLVAEAGYAAAMAELEATVGLARVPVLHANDAKAARGSHHDRHAHIGEGALGREFFRRLLHDRRLGGKAFILETPVDAAGDAARDLAMLRRLGR